MSPQNDDLTPKDYPEQRKLRGLYRHVKISVKTLDRIILVGIIAIVVAIFIAVRQGGYTVTGEGDPAIDALVMQRYEAKKAKNFAEADRIRDELKAQGIEIVDTKDGASWKRV